MLFVFCFMLSAFCVTLYAFSFQLYAFSFMLSALCLQPSALCLQPSAFFTKIKNIQMNKFLLITLITSITLMACNENDNEDKGSKSGKIIEMQVVKTSSDTLAKIPMKVSDLSQEELKDDSLFVDGSVPTSWDIAGVTDVKGLKLFIKQLQQWVINNDKEAPFFKSADYGVLGDAFTIVPKLIEAVKKFKANQN